MQTFISKAGTTALNIHAIVDAVERGRFAFNASKDIETMDTNVPSIVCGLENLYKVMRGFWLFSTNTG